MVTMTDFISPDYESAPEATCKRMIRGYLPPVKVKKVLTPTRAPRRSPRRAARTTPGFFNETALTRHAHRMKTTTKRVEKKEKKGKNAK
jgi:hypothetical protein